MRRRFLANLAEALAGSPYFEELAWLTKRYAVTVEHPIGRLAKSHRPASFTKLHKKCVVGWDHEGATNPQLTRSTHRP